MSTGTTTATRAVRAAQAADRDGQSHAPINVGRSERLVSLAGGSLLAAYGLSRGTTTGLALGLVGAGLAYRGWTGRCQVYQLLGMNSVEHDGQTSIPSGQGVKIEESITIQKPADELFRFWRKFENLPKVMEHLVSVRELDARRSEWKAHGLVGDVQWEAEILEERPPELISWRSLEGSTVATAGSVRFQPAPGNRGTEVKVVLSYNPPAGQAGHALAWLAGRDPASQVREDLRNLKCLMETGSLVTTAGQPRGRCAS